MMLRVLHHLSIYVVFNIPSGTANVTLYVPFLISYAVLAKILLPITYLNPLLFAIRVRCIFEKQTTKSNFT